MSNVGVKIAEGVSKTHKINDTIWYSELITLADEIDSEIEKRMNCLKQKQKLKELVGMYRNLASECCNNSSSDFANQKYWLDLKVYFDGVADAFDSNVEENLQLKRRVRKTLKDLKISKGQF